MSAGEKVVSIHESHIDIIVKDGRETLYAHKIYLTGGASGLVLDCLITDGNPADSTLSTRRTSGSGSRQRFTFSTGPLGR